MSKKAYIVINDGAAFDGKINVDDTSAKIYYTTNDGAFNVTASFEKMKVRFVGQGASYTLMLDTTNKSYLLLETNGSFLAPAAIQLELYRFVINSDGVFLTTQYYVEENLQSLTLSATISQ